MNIEKIRERFLVVKSPTILYQEKNESYLIH